LPPLFAKAVVLRFFFFLFAAAVFFHFPRSKSRRRRNAPARPQKELALGRKPQSLESLLMLNIGDTLREDEAL
jgi:hypothetical protein